jgi:hypothetical protein
LASFTRASANVASASRAVSQPVAQYNIKAVGHVAKLRRDLSV